MSGDDQLYKTPESDARNDKGLNKKHGQFQVTGRNH